MSLTQNEDMRERIRKKILSQKLIVILRGLPDDRLLRIMEALAVAGVGLAEITFNHESEAAAARAPEQIDAVRRRFGSSMEIGAGTVLSPADVCAAKEAGAGFVISPNVDEKVIRTTRENGMVSIPGAYTPSEICSAYAYGADFVKVFPMIERPAEYIRALHAPLSHIPLLAVGGITPENAAEVLKAGAVGVGVGSYFVKPAALSGAFDQEDYAGIADRARRFIAVLK